MQLFWRGATPLGRLVAMCRLRSRARSPTGTYELRLFRNDSFTRLATSNTFTVTGGGGGLTLTVSPTECGGWGHGDGNLG